MDGIKGELLLRTATSSDRESQAVKQIRDYKADEEDAPEQPFKIAFVKYCCGFSWKVSFWESQNNHAPA